MKKQFWVSPLQISGVVSSSWTSH